MKIIKIFFLIILTIFVSCSKSESEIVNPLNISGNYFGTFERNGVISDVQLNLNNGIFTGQSTIQKFPAICNGTFFISGSNITFVNNCVWTAEFDWTLILGGNWNYIFNDNVLVLTKANGDKYILTQ